MFTILAFRFPAVDFAGILRTLVLCFALVAVPVFAIVAVNLLWPLIVAVLGKLLLGGGLTVAYAAVTRA